jgi:hypothetical protein
VTDAQDPPAGAWDGAFPGNIPLYNSIEWLELNPLGPGLASGGRKDRRPDFHEALKRELGAAGIPIEETAAGIRIIGYARSGSGKK